MKSEFEIENQVLSLYFDFDLRQIKAKTEYSIIPLQPKFTITFNKNIKIYSARTDTGKSTSHVAPHSSEHVVPPSSDNVVLPSSDPSTTPTDALPVETLTLTRTEKEIIISNAIEPFKLEIDYFLDYKFFISQKYPQKFDQCQLNGIFVPFHIDKNTWDLYITIPKTIDNMKMVCISSGDLIGRFDLSEINKIDQGNGKMDIDLTENDMAINTADSSGLDGDTFANTADKARELDEMELDEDPSPTPKDVTELVCYQYKVKIPIEAASLVIVIGPFESTRFSHTEENVVEQKSRVTVFYLPRFQKHIHQSCFYLPQALQFVEQWVGASYPFGSLYVVFSETSHAPIVTGAQVIVASINLILQENVIDQVFQTRFTLCYAIANQWFGHYVSPSTWEDSWILVGFSRVIAYMFMKKIHGLNEFKFRIKKDTERVCVVDTKQLPLSPIYIPSAQKDLLTGYGFKALDDPASLRGELVHLKSGLVLLMMEKRFGKGLLSKLASKIMFYQMSGELAEGISTLELLKQTRKMTGKLEIKEFADQWVFGSGIPIFTTNYNFNRKKMVIELKIFQKSSNEGMVGSTGKFTGPFTIRVQEPGGTFDTEVRIEEYGKQYDIIYHTKYKRIRRGATKKSKKGEEDEVEEIEELEEEEDMDQEGLVAEPDRITFEWIRLDPDNIWLCHLSFEQEDFMWNSMMRQDKDVNAQYEAIVALWKIQSMPTGAMLGNILKDNSFFYRLRMEAAFQLAKFDTEKVEYLGLSTLLKYVTENYLLDPSQPEFIPKRNDFRDMQEYFIRNAIITALSQYRDDRGWTPVKVRKILIDFLRFNDNTNNPFSDSVYVSTLIDSIGNTFLQRPKNEDDITWCLTEQIKHKVELQTDDVEEFDFPTANEYFTRNNSDTVKNFFVEEDHELLEIMLEEISRYLVKDCFGSSFQNSVTVSCLEVLTKWQIAGLIPVNLTVFLSYSRFGHFIQVRKMAIESLILVSALTDLEICKYLALICIYDQDESVRYSTSMSLLYFIELCISQNEASQQTERKTALKTQMETILSIWNEHKGEQIPWYIEKHFEKLEQVNLDFIPIKPKLKFKMPSMQSVKEVLKTNKIISKEGLSFYTEESPKLEVARKPLAKKVSAPVKVKEEVIIKKPYLEKCYRQWKRTDHQKNAYWFRHPVDPVALNIPTYFDIVKTPMSLIQVKNNIIDEKYETEDEFVRDMRLVFTNAIIFNPEHSQVRIEAQTLLQKFEKDFLGIKPEVVKVPEMTFQDIAKKVLEKLLLCPHAALFSDPVDRNLYPHYFDMVPNPMDLRTIGSKISQYSYLQDFHDDCNLVFSNCFTFNIKGTFGYQEGLELKSLYVKLMKPYTKLFSTRPTIKKTIVPESITVASPSTGIPKIKLSKPKEPQAMDVDVDEIVRVKQKFEGAGTRPKVTLKLKAPIRVPDSVTSSPIPSGLSFKLKPPKAPDVNSVMAPVAPSPSGLTFRLKPPKAPVLVDMTSGSPLNVKAPASESRSGLTFKVKPPAAPIVRESPVVAEDVPMDVDPVGSSVTDTPDSSAKTFKFKLKLKPPKQD